MKRLLPLLSLPLVFCSGCLTYFGVTLDSERPLAEPAEIPESVDLSADFPDYGVFAIAADPSPFAEAVRATDMGRGGLTQTVGMVPLRTVAAHGLASLVENHFRAPLPDERPAAVLTTTPQFISIRQDGRTARVKVKVAVQCVKQDENRTVLLKNIYDGERTGPWVKGEVPVALYEALDDIWTALLREFRDTIRPATLMDGAETSLKMPKLGNVSFENAKDKLGMDVLSGRCSIDCNGWEAAQAQGWAKREILKLCASHLGVEKKRTGIRFDDKGTVFDSKSQSWSFRFTAWAKTPMALQYDSVYRKGRAILDLDLFQGTVEEAVKTAEKYIIREMNLRAGTYADDAPEAVADIRFGKMEQNLEKNRIILPFSLVY